MPLTVLSTDYDSMFNINSNVFINANIIEYGNVFLLGLL